MHEDSEPKALAAVFKAALPPLEGTNSHRVLDFGCGAGRLVHEMHLLGIEAYGCDIQSYLADDLAVPPDRFAHLSFDPYQLPYPDNFFDAVVSSSVLEHAQNYEEVLHEIKRVLKPGGLSMHVFPAKWYLPTEPHMFVPLVSWLWPHVPRWWLALWARLGIRNEFQQGLSAADVVEKNVKYSREGISYLSTRAWTRVSMRVFGNVSWPMDIYLAGVGGGVAKIWRKLPFKRLIGLLSREMRMAFMVHRKMPD
ncbi:MAG: class I SAM-dependent methyltransferase [Pseudomonadota bacterium]|nr:class I SAM-dependent methyltransferase [Pseudomonadota bacterium]